MIIVGAGLAGLIAGHVFPNAKIIERNPATSGANHAALLRFRSDVVSNITGITFRRVTVRKGIWSRGQYAQPTIQLANKYALKCTGVAAARSIWDISAAERFVAPLDFYERMVMACFKRIEWGTKYKRVDITEPVISTAPLHDNAAEFLGFTAVEFRRAPILVERWTLPGTDVHQTVYFPDDVTSTYRISITGDKLIAESVISDAPAMSVSEMMYVLGLGASMAGEAQSFGTVVKQSHGKIAPIDERLRKELVHRLSTEADVYSVGRFATWRNILLDDVVKDLRIVKAMIEQNDVYNRRLQSL